VSRSASTTDFVFDHPIQHLALKRIPKAGTTEVDLVLYSVKLHLGIKLQISG